MLTELLLYTYTQTRRQLKPLFLVFELGIRMQYKIVWIQDRIAFAGNRVLNIAAKFKP